MKLSSAQQADLLTVKHFMPRKSYPSRRVSGKAVKEFFDYSDKGIKPVNPSIGYQMLLEGKRWRGIHMEMYEEGVLEGTMPYAIILKGMPKVVKEFCAKEMFKGMDKDIILKYDGV